MGRVGMFDLWQDLKLEILSFNMEKTKQKTKSI